MASDHPATWKFDFPIYHPPDMAAWRAWPTANHEVARGVWVATWGKASGRDRHSSILGTAPPKTPVLPPGSVVSEMSSDPLHPAHSESLELSVEELLRRVRPLPPREEMVIEDLTPEEGEAFLAAISS